MKKSQLRKIIRECICDVLKEEDTPAIDPKIDAIIDNKAAELVKPGSKVYNELDSKLLPKLQQMSPEDLKKFIDAVTTGMETLGVDPGDTVTRQTIDSSTKKPEVEKAAKAAVEKMPLKEWSSLSEGAKLAGLAAAAGDIMGTLGKLNLAFLGFPGGLLSAALLAVIPGNQPPDAVLAGTIAAAAASGGMIMLGNWLNSNKVQNALASKGVTKVSENSMRAKLRNEIRKAIKEEEAAVEVPKSVETADSEMAKLAKLVKKLPDDLKAKLVKKVKAAQGEVSSYIDDIKSKEDKKD
jgi:hypothetical protein